MSGITLLGQERIEGRGVNLRRPYITSIPKLIPLKLLLDHFQLKKSWKDLKVAFEANVSQVYSPSGSTCIFILYKTDLRSIHENIICRVKNRILHLKID